MLGIVLFFSPEFAKVRADTLLMLGIGFALASFFFVSLGNVISERILGPGTPVIQMNFWAMTYGTFFIFTFALISGLEWVLASGRPTIYH